MENETNQEPNNKNTKKEFFTEQDILLVMTDNHTKTGLGTPKFPKEIHNYENKKPTPEQINSLFQMKMETSQRFLVLKYLNIENPLEVHKEQLLKQKSQLKPGLTKEQKQALTEKKGQAVAQNIKEAGKGLDIK